MIFGDKMDFVSVLINIDPIIVGKWAEDRGISFTTFMDLSLKPEVAELIGKQVEEFNRNVEKPHFRIRRWAMLYKLLDVDDGEVKEDLDASNDLHTNSQLAEEKIPEEELDD